MEVGVDLAKPGSEHTATTVWEKGKLVSIEEVSKEKGPHALKAGKSLWPPLR